MGISKWNAGVIRPVAVAPTGPYQNSAAPGVWTLDQQAYWQKQGLWPTAGSVDPSAFIENLFSTYLYTGNGSTQTITNGIDLSGKGGLVWVKSRSAGYLSHVLADTVRGNTKVIYSNLTAPQDTFSTGISSFNSNGFSIGSSDYYNESAGRFVSWTFREQAKFFDVVTYEGTGSTRSVSHNLGSVPGFIIVKNTSNTADWAASLAPNGDWNNRKIFLLNTSDADGALATYTNGFINTATSTTVSLTQNAGTNVNASGNTYVMYLFAHNAGGFGLNGTDNVISCGTFTTDGSGAAGNITLGYEAQWVLIKRVDAAGSWLTVDTMRGSSLTSYSYLSPNTANAESSSTSTQGIYPTATGFFVGNNAPAANATYIYIAIRRGPMKTPTTGTSVFNLASAIEPDTTPLFSPGTPPPDLIWHKPRININPHEFYFADRLRGNNVILASNAQDAERSATASVVPPWKFNSGQKAQLDAGVYFNNSGGAGQPYALYSLIRAPGFFDEVITPSVYTTGIVNHNLTVVPELMIEKTRSTSTTDWRVYHKDIAAGGALNLADAFDKSLYPRNPTSTTFEYGNNNAVDYLFATCAGVSKVGSYTGTGALQTINCGFAAGARFVLIKRTDSTGAWYVWDSARGISSGNDPYILMNSTAIEVTGTNYVDTTAVGFQVTAAAPAAINANGGSFIFLAIA